MPTHNPAGTWSESKPGSCRFVDDAEPTKPPGQGGNEMLSAIVGINSVNCLDRCYTLGMKLKSIFFWLQMSVIIKDII